MSQSSGEQLYIQLMSTLWNVFPDFSPVGENPFEGIGRYVTPGYRDRLIPLCVPDVIERLAGSLSGIYDGLPDAEIATESPAVEENQITARWIIRGTHNGKFADYDATGRRIWFTGILKFDVVKEKIAKVSIQWDREHIRDQLAR